MFLESTTTQTNTGRTSARNTRNLLVITTCLFAAALITNTAGAYLGSFNQNDGYLLQTGPLQNYNWADVTYYNAGSFGANAGGGFLTAIAPDSGKWKLISQVGGFFGSSANRNAAVGTAPPYPTSNPGGTIPAYLVGQHFPGHNNSDNANLAFRNDTTLGTGAAVYDYYLDQYDLGATPSSITTGNIDTEFYFLPTDGVPNTPGSVRRDKFTLSFVDTSGAMGLQWGYAWDNEVTWRTNPSGPWNYTGIYAAEQNSPNNPLWDGVSIDINLSSDTFQFDYFVAATNTWNTVVPAGTALNLGGLGDLTRLRWRLEDDVHGYFAGKNYFDDFSFKTSTVPEPAAAALVAVAVAAFAARRHKRRD